MLAVLWLIIWVTVGDAFYDDFNWYTSDDGISGQRAFDPQRIVRENFTNILRNYADSYIPTQEGDELTMEKVKSRLRMLKIFTHMGNSNDYEPSKGKFLPLSEGAGFCTMGRQTKVGCNHCTCVAGQLYMCTGMICPKPLTKPKSVIACKEGERRRIDSCNYCYCRNGHEICSTRDCRLQHDHLLIRSQYTCQEGVRRKVDCNRCICRNGEEYCSRKKCSKKKPTQMKFRQYNKMPEGHCNDGQSLKIDCRVCKCTQNRWHCSDKNCGTKMKIDDLPPNCRRGDEITVNCVPCICRKRGWKCYVKKRKRNCRPDKNEEFSLAEPPQALRMTYSHYDDEPPRKCEIGERQRIDACNYCYCNRDRELVCTNNKCTYSRHVDHKYPLDIDKKQCQIGSRFRTDECNYCYCNYNRHLVCSENKCTRTRKSRYDLSDDRELLRFTPAPKICLPHERFRLDNCNWCYCTKDRKRICERNPCPKSQKPDTRWPPNSPRRGCYIGSRFDRGKCEYCYCSVWRRIECRLRYNCIDNTTTTMKPIIKATKQRTKPRNSFNFECEVGQIQRVDDCNVCRCTYSRTWMCTDNVCPSNYDHHDLSDYRELLRFTPAPKICLPHERFRLDNCNWCYCTKDRKRICERNPCPKSQKPDTRWPPNSPRRGCYIGSRFDRGKCEYCYCSVWRRIECRLRYNCIDNTTTTMKPIIKATKQRTKPRNSFNFECEVGQIQRVDDCNVCRCTYSRTWMCTDNVCPSNYDHHDLSDYRELLRFTPAPKICLPHERFRLDNCNWCYCTKDRKRICERNPCPKSQKPDTRWPPNSPRRGCYIGSRFDRGKCEYCYCSVWRRIECRLRYNCIDNTTTTMKPIIKATKQRTKPRNSFNFECEVGQIQRVDDCNVCRCTYSRTWMCTDNVCPSNYDHLPMVFSEPECLVGEPVPAQDPCNVCICLDSHILCTDNPCIQRQTVGEDPMCVEGHKYYLSDVCNYCICQAGQYFCTSRACLVPGKLIPGAATCIDGEVTTGKDSCNMCVCNKGRIDCTNNLCNNLRKPKDAKSESFLSYIRTQNNKNHKKAQGTKQKCTPGKKYFPEDFDPNCPNECICDRHELLCTKRKCYNNWDKKTPFQWPLGRLQDTLKSRNVNNYLKQDTCVEYQKLPSDDPCNECICLNARKVCTTISCSDDNEAEHDSVKALFNLNVQGSKRKKGNMVKQNNNFCEPFTFFSPDDNRFCRNCFCLHNGLALCLLNLCKYSKDIPNQNSPEELDTVCNPGETGHPTKCVTCTCSAHRKWICTREELALCYERECDEKDEFHMGFFPYCAGCKCSVKEWFCSIESDTCQDFSNAICPLGTFIHNPKQHCSICLCGGYQEGSHNMCFTEAKCVRQVNSQLKLKQ